MVMVERAVSQARENETCDLWCGSEYYVLNGMGAITSYFSLVGVFAKLCDVYSL